MKIIKISLLLSSITAAFAAYGPSHDALKQSAWTLGVGYGQMLNTKKYINNGEEFKTDKFAIIEADLFHENGYGAVLMTTASKKGVFQDSPTATGKYSFIGYFMGYQKTIANEAHLRLLIGMSDQKFVSDAGDTEESGNEFAYAISLNKNMLVSKSGAAFAELGYLGQKKFELNSFGDFVSGSGYYFKLGYRVNMS